MVWQDSAWTTASGLARSYSARTTNMLLGSTTLEIFNLMADSVGQRLLQEEATARGRSDIVVTRSSICSRDPL